MSGRRVAVVVPDLFFAARIAETARTLGVETRSLAPDRALAACRAEPPDLVILDLHAAGDPVTLARSLKSDAATRAVPIVGFCSHVEVAVRQAALDAGVDRVLPRSAFTARLAGILSGVGADGTPP